MDAFQHSQYQFTRYLRHPEQHPRPDGIEERRLAIYRDLVYNNIEGFISSGFPVLRGIYADADWHALVRDFVDRHRSQTPYFLEIGQEFLQYLMHEREPIESDPAFLLELAHYEWVELALDVAHADLPPPSAAEGDLLAGRPRVSTLLWCLSYQFPVHRIGPGFQPEGPPAQPSFLLVYRDREDKVQFMESNAVTVALVQAFQADSELTGADALAQIAQQLNHPNPARLREQGRELLEQLRARDILVAVE